MKLKIYQIYYSWFQWFSVQHGFKPYFNAGSNRYLENQVILDCYQNHRFKNCDYFGVLSWRFEEKTKLNFDQIANFIKKEKSSADVYAFFQDPDQRSRVKKNMWKHAVEMWHPPLFIEIGQMIFDELKIKANILDLETPVIYSNYWIARPQVFAGYVERLLAPAVKIMEENETIKRLCYEDSGYDRQKSISIKQREKIFGRPYFTFHPFICERLFSSWLALNPNIRFNYIS